MISLKLNFLLVVLISPSLGANLVEQFASGRIPLDCKKVKVWLLWGQSNIEGGYGTNVADLEVPLGSHPADLATLYCQRYQTSPPSNGNDGTISMAVKSDWGLLMPKSFGRFGPEIGFARTLWDLGYKNNIIISTSWSGASIEEDLEPVVADWSGWINSQLDKIFYDETPGDRAAHAFDGMVVYQGESEIDVNPEDWGLKFHDYIEKAAPWYGVNKLAIVRVHSARIPLYGGNYRSVRAAQEKFVNSFPDLMSLIDVDETSYPSDPPNNLHHDTLGQEQIGKLIAQRLYQMNFKIEEVDYENWRSCFFTEDQLSDQSISGVLADFDGDQLVTLQEFFFGTDPTACECKTVSMWGDNDLVYLKYPHNLEAVNIRATVEETSDLEGGVWTEANLEQVSTEVIGNQEWITLRTVSKISEVSNYFLRLRIEAQ